MFIDFDKIMHPIHEMNHELVSLLREISEKLDQVVTELQDLNRNQG